MQFKLLERVEVEGHALYSTLVTTVAALQHITYPPPATNKSHSRKSTSTTAGEIFPAVVNINYTLTKLLVNIVGCAFSMRF